MENMETSMTGSMTVVSTDSGAVSKLVYMALELTTVLDDAISSLENRLLSVLDQSPSIPGTKQENVAGVVSSPLATDLTRLVSLLEDRRDQINSLRSKVDL